MKGHTWNESKLYKDPVTLRQVRQITTQGIVNTVPSYHTGQAFSKDGTEVIFITIREGKSILCKANLVNGDITALINPVDGMGGLNDMDKFGNGKGISIGAVLAPESRWAYYIVERQVRAVHMDTLEEKIIINGIEEEHFIESIAISPDEKRFVYVIDILHPEKNGKREYQIVGTAPDGNNPIVLLSEKGTSANHIMFNPTDSNILLYCRDMGPSPTQKADENSRAWIYRIASETRTNVRTCAKQNFQTHVAWTWDGKGIIYHGMLGNSTWKNNLNEPGWYIGLANLNGISVKEYSFPDAPYYGHVSSMMGKNAAIIDGNILGGLLMWIYFDEELPKIEIIAKHDTDFTTMPCQYSHPHAICNPTGRQIVFNSAPRRIFYGPRSDIYAVEVDNPFSFHCYLSMIPV